MQMASGGGLLNLQFVDETGNVEADDDFDGPRGSSTMAMSMMPSSSRKRRLGPGSGVVDWEDESGGDSDDCGMTDEVAMASGVGMKHPPRPGKKTRGRVKIRMAYITDKVRRYTTFSKRKTGIMKKAYELAVLTGTQVMLLVASETGHVYTFATKKLQPVIMSENGKALIQTCLNSPDAPPSPHTKEFSTTTRNDERMNPLGFEEPGLMYASTDDKNDVAVQFKPTVAPNEPVSSENPAKSTSVSVLNTVEHSSTVSKSSSHLPKSVLQQNATAVGAYIAALKESKVATLPENTVMVLPQSVSTHEGSSQSQQLYYRIEGSNRLIPISTESCSAAPEERLKLNPMANQPLAVVNGGANSASMLMYPGQPAVVLPVQSSSARNLLSEGYLLNIANASNLAVAADGSGGMTQSIFTLPFTVPNSQISQADPTPASLTNSLMGFAGELKKSTQRK